MIAKGFTLIELMIAVAIIAVLAAVALPAYNGYIASSQRGVLMNNIATMEVFQEDLRLRTGNYAAGNYDLAGGDTSLQGAIGWAPQSDDGTVYSVVLAGGGYEVTATAENGASVCMAYPAKQPC
jgi:prepilin-type N-terminal cleavage/methylation domain-containing protein